MAQGLGGCSIPTGTHVFAAEYLIKLDKCSAHTMRQSPVRKSEPKHPCAIGVRMSLQARANEAPRTRLHGGSGRFSLEVTSGV